MTASTGGGRRTSIALAIIATVQLMIILDSTVVNVALPEIQRDMEFSSATLSWVLNAYTLTFGGLLLLGGRMGDLLGRRRVFLGGVSLFTVASLAGGVAQSGEWLLAARALQGIGAAIAAPSVFALVMTNFAEGTPRNRALGVVTAVSAAGASVGLILGGMLTTWVSWRWTLIINVPVGLAVVPLAHRFLDESERATGRFDVAGALSSTLGAGALVYGFIRVAEDGWGDTVALAAFALAIVVLAGFVAHESRTAQPLLPLRLLAGRTASSGYLAMLALPAAMMGMFFFLTQFLQQVDGFTALKTGLAFLPLTALIFGASQVVPALLPKHGPRPFLLGGMTLIVAGMAWLTQIDDSTGYVSGLLGPMLLFGLGAGLSFMPLSALILGSARAEDSGAASGMLNAMQQVGGTLGLAILVTVFGTATDGADTAGAAPADAVFASGISDAFVAATAFAALAALLSAFAVSSTRGPLREVVVEPA